TPKPKASVSRRAKINDGRASPKPRTIITRTPAMSAGQRRLGARLTSPAVLSAGCPVMVIETAPFAVLEVSPARLWARRTASSKPPAAATGAAVTYHRVLAGG